MHTQCCVFKVNGDYLDTRIRNSPTELRDYPPEFNQLLDRIFDEFGLIVCGWSAEWDNALRDAIFRAPSRRFTTYWALRGEAGDEARKLIDHRRAEVINIEDADGFFQAVQQSVESIHQFSRPHPLSTEAAVVSLKRYLPESRYRIHLSDLVGETVERVVESTAGEAFDMNSPDPNTETVTARVRAYEAACSTLLAMAAVGGRWAEEEHVQVWQQAIERLAAMPRVSGYNLWRGLLRYPATLLLYVLGLGAVASERLNFLGRIFATRVPEPDRNAATSVVQLLPPFCLFESNGHTMRLLNGMERHYAPLNNWIHEALREHTRDIIPNDERYTLVFDKLETLIALSFAHHGKRLDGGIWYWAPSGMFWYRGDNRRQILEELHESISTHGDESPFVESRIFGGTAEACQNGLDALQEFGQKLGPPWW